jgi:WD40 repeat protein
MLCAVAIFSLTFTAQAQEATERVVFDDAPTRFRGIEPRFWPVAFSPDEKSLVVTARWENPEEPGQVVVWDLESRSPKLNRSQEKTTRSAAFSPDGNLLAICDFGGSTKLLDLTFGEVVGSMPTRTAFTTDRNKLIAGGFDGRSVMWDIATGKEVHKLTVEDDLVVTLVASPAGQHIAAVTWHGPPTGGFDVREKTDAQLEQGGPGGAWDSRNDRFFSR